MPLVLLHRILLLIASAMFVACGAVQPEGHFKDVLDGKIFERQPRNIEEEKKKEQTMREIEKQVPPPSEDQGAVQFRVKL